MLEKNPGSHTQSATLVCLAPRVKALGGHGLQKLWSSAPAWLLYVPRPHSICFPAEHQCPGSQCEQSSLALRPEALPTVPLGHGVGAELPAAHQAARSHSLHAVALASPWYRPASHGVGCEELALQKPPREHGRGWVAPPAHQLRAGQPTHASSVIFMKVPGSHDAGVGDTLPIGHRVPRAHSTQLVAPASFWCEPSAQLLHDALDSLAANVPGVHGVGEVAPTPQAFPGGQMRQASAELRPVSLPNRPALQSCGANEPSGQ